MSEASITYKEEGERCGIFNVLNSELKNHEVCEDGLACVYEEISNDVFRKACRSIEVIEGDRCLPQYDMCYSNLQCLKNVDDEYTCGGVVPWTQNPEYVNTGYVKTSEYCINVPFIVVGVCILFIYLVYLFYEIYIKNNPKSIYSKRINTITNGWVHNIFR